MKGNYAIALFLSLCMGTALIGGCGQQEGTQEKTDALAQNETTADKKMGEDVLPDEGGSTNSDYHVTWDDMAEINVVIPTLAAIPDGLSQVEEAVNEITESTINTHVNIELLEPGSYDQQVSLKITSGEQVDLVMTNATGSTSFTTMVSQNQLQDITQLMKSYAPKAMAAVGDAVKGTTVDGRIMAFPAYRNYYSGAYIMMRTDVLEDLGLVEKAESMTSFSEYEEILETVKNSEKWKELVPIVPTRAGSILPWPTYYGYTENFSDTQFIDTLGNILSCVGVLNDDETSTVINVYASDAYKRNYERTKEWYDAGYIYKDAANTAELGTELIKSGIGFSMFNSMGVGAELAANAQCGRDMTCVLIAAKPVNTSDCATFTYAVPVTAKAPEVAMTFVEMMFNDENILNLMVWGIEGKDYEINESGIAQKVGEKGSPSYYLPSWNSVNEFNTIPCDPWDMESWNNQKTIMDEAVMSDYLGFSLNTDSLSNETSAVNTVLNEYTKQLGAGVASETDYEAFIKKLNATGIEKIVAAYQAALNDWLAKTN